MNCCGRTYRHRLLSLELMVAEAHVDVVSHELDKGEFGDLVGTDHIAASCPRGRVSTDI